MVTYSAISGQPEFLKVTVGVRNAVLTDVHDRLVEAPYTAPLAQSPPSCLSRETDSVNLLFVGFPFRPIPLTAFSTRVPSSVAFKVLAGGGRGNAWPLTPRGCH